MLLTGAYCPISQVICVAGTTICPWTSRSAEGIERAGIRSSCRSGAVVDKRARLPISRVPGDAGACVQARSGIRAGRANSRTRAVPKGTVVDGRASGAGSIVTTVACTAVTPWSKVIAGGSCWSTVVHSICTIVDH